jgi:hydroxymethylglutaryl-CoA synthase
VVEGAAAVRPVAVLGVGASAPSLRLSAADVGAAWGTGGGRGAVAACDADEDTLTLGWRAATDALEAAGVTPGEVTGLWWGTSRPPMAEGPSFAFLATALGLGSDIAGALMSGSPHAGMEALAAAWDALASGHASVALVVASDALVPGPGTAGESTTGAGAAAVVLGSLPVPAGDGARPGGGGHPTAAPSGAASTNGASPPARLVARASRVVPALDRYRADAGAVTEDVYDARLFREEIYVPLLSEVGRAVADLAGGAPVSWAISDPDGKLGAALSKRLGAPLASAPVQRALGDAGAAAALLGLVQACADAGEGTGALGTVGVIGYGGGRASAVIVDMARAVPGAWDVAANAAGRAASYVEVLRARGRLEASGEAIPMGVPPGGAAFVRGNREMLALTGARCADCGAISTPPSIHPTCVGCGGTHLDVVALARRGRVQTFVVNQTMPPPFQAPLPLVVIDLDDGARVMVQGSPADAEALAIGDAVALTLRRYALERGVPVYGYKALRASGGAVTNAAAAVTTAAKEGSR